MKRILVTGINGFVGSHLADRLLESEPDAELFGLKKVNARLRNIKKSITSARSVGSAPRGTCPRPTSRSTPSAR